MQVENGLGKCDYCGEDTGFFDDTTGNHVSCIEISKLRQALTEANALYNTVEAINLDLTERIEAMQVDAKLSDMAWKDNQAALKAQAETITRLEAELAQCKHALDDEGETCECGHYGNEHKTTQFMTMGCFHHNEFDVYCTCLEFRKAAK